MTSQQNNSQELSAQRSTRAGVVLCGGKSSRMGRSKADLEFGDETMLQRVVRILSQVVNHVVIVASAEQKIGSMAPDQIACEVSIARDQMEFAGPLAGLSVGLEALQHRSSESKAEHLEAAYVTSCDVPFLHPSFVNELFDNLGDANSDTNSETNSPVDVVVPFDDKHLHPMAAVYRLSVATHIRELLERGERRPRALFDIVPTRRIATTSLEGVDPGLLTLLNLNSPSEYKAALNRAKLPIPNWALTAE